MQLASDWARVFRYAWSIRWWIAVAFLFTTLEIGLPSMDGYETIPCGVFVAFFGLPSAMAFLSRLMAQKDLSDADKQDRRYQARQG